MAASSDFAFNKFCAVIDKPADFRVGQTGENSVFLCPCNHSPGRVNMRYLRAGRSCGDRRASGVGEQVQYPDLTSASGGVSDQPGKPFPVRCLFGEQSCVFKTERLEPEGQAAAG